MVFCGQETDKDNTRSQHYCATNGNYLKSAENCSEMALGTRPSIDEGTIKSTFYS
jgi:hypothetical protein